MNEIKWTLKQQQEANHFAFELLMPEYKFVELFKETSGNFKLISQFFCTSMQACKLRAFSLGLITNPDFTS